MKKWLVGSIIGTLVVIVIAVAASEIENRKRSMRSTKLQEDLSRQFFQAFSEAKGLRARNKKSIGWHIDESRWVDLSDSRDKLLPFFDAEICNGPMTDDDIVSSIVVEGEHETLTADIICLGKAPMIFRFKNGTYRRKGVYRPIIGRDVFTSESAEFSYMVAALVDGGQEDRVARSWIHMLLSAGIGGKGDVFR